MGCLPIYGKGAIEHGGVWKCYTGCCYSQPGFDSKPHMGCLSPFRANASWFSLRGFLPLWEGLKIFLIVNVVTVSENRGLSWPDVALGRINPRSGGSWISQRGLKEDVPTYYLAKICWKLHENEVNWTERERASEILLCRFATTWVCMFLASLNPNKI